MFIVTAIPNTRPSSVGAACIRLSCLCAAFLISLILISTAHATSPHLTSIIPTGAQRGTELEVTFSGERLQDTEEIFCYEPGIQVLKLNSLTNKTVKAQVKVAPDCKLGEHHQI